MQVYTSHQMPAFHSFVYFIYQTKIRVYTLHARCTLLQQYEHTRVLSVHRMLIYPGMVAAVVVTKVSSRPAVYGVIMST